jgi:AcrR family transcriptional regulator
MVERIIAAGHDVLLERGYDATTTNHIAERAGISPGSLYQYFPDKAAILAQVLDRYSAELIARMSRAFLRALGAPTGDAVRTLVTTMLDAYEENPGLLRVLMEQVPRSPDSARAVFARRMDDMLTTAILAQPGHDPERPADVAAWLVVRAVEHVTISHILEGSEHDRSVVVDELTAMIVGYLDGARQVASEQ